MKPYAAAFYNSQAWKQCRDAYFKSVGGLCELCLKEGKITPGEIVHHRIHLNPSTIKNPDITLAWDNLQCVCREHHAELHGAKLKRYKLDDLGRVIINN